MIITIDGPTASGKSTLAALLAQKLSAQGHSACYLNTGFLFRALAYVLMRDYHYTFEQLLHPLPAQVHAILSHLNYEYRDGRAYIIYADTDITLQLKNATIDQAASIIGGVTLVRLALLEWQRSFVQKNACADVVTDGRDSGTVVFPYADKKFFVTASLEERAHRWQADELRRGNKYTLEESIQQLTIRDERDMNRPIAPLHVPKNAIIVDTTHMTIDQAVEALVKAL